MNTLNYNKNNNIFYMNTLNYKKIIIFITQIIIFVYINTQKYFEL